MTQQPAQRQPGKAAPQFPSGLHEYQAYLNPVVRLPEPPEVLNRYQQISQWPQDGNANYGDCSMAAAAHAIHAWNIATRQSHPIPTTEAVLKEYFRLTKGADIPLVEADVLQHWHQTGLWGHRILGYTPINLSNIHLIKQAVYLYGLVLVGVQLTNGAQHQWKLKKEWALQRGWKSETIIGGHAVPIIGYDQDSFTAVTWGRAQKMSFDWWHRYGDEAWAIFPVQLEEAGGCDHLNLAQLHADLNSI